MSGVQRTRRHVILGCIALANASVACVWIATYPVHSGASRLALLAVGALVMILVLWLTWAWRWVRSALLGGLGLLAAWLGLMPARDADPAALRAAYVSALRSLVDTPYVWGGESRRGIDCSGLVRRGWRDALVQTAQKRMDAGRLRQSLAIWWQDCSAKELGRGYRGRCRRLTTATSLASLDHALVQPGDLAVTADGLHVLAYLGDRRWISADPSAQQVIIDEVDRSANHYLAVSVVLMRWLALDPVEEE